MPTHGPPRQQAITTARSHRLFVVEIAMKTPTLWNVVDTKRKKIWQRSRYQQISNRTVHGFTFGSSPKDFIPNAKMPRGTGFLSRDSSTHDSEKYRLPSLHELHRFWNVSVLIEFVVHFHPHRFDILVVFAFLQAIGQTTPCSLSNTP